MDQVAVIGSGTMGNGIAHHFALHNFKVFLIDISNDQLSKARHTITSNLERQVKKEIINTQKKEEALAKITYSTNYEDIRSISLAIEAVSEIREIKKQVLNQVNAIVSESAIIASNTSSISITELASHVSHPERFIGMHFMNPVPIMKLVEVIKGYATSDEVVNTISRLARSINKEPVIVNDYPGFVSNRILMPMINEGIYALYEGVAGVREIDAIMKLGMAHPMGPLQLADYIGLDVCLSILKVLHEGFGNPKYSPCPLLINMVNAGKLGVKSGEGFYNWNTSSGELTPSNRFLK